MAPASASDAPPNFQTSSGGGELLRLLFGIEDVRLFFGI